MTAKPSARLTIGLATVLELTGCLAATPADVPDAPDGGVGETENQDDDEDDMPGHDVGDGYDEAEDTGSTGSTGEGESSSSSGDAMCADFDAVPELPYAIARQEGAGLVIELRSDESSCEASSSVSAEESLAKLSFDTLHVGVGRYELRTLDATARLGAQGPGNNGGVPTLAWLSGTAHIQSSDDAFIVGTIRDTVVPFVGCFAARLCPVVPTEPGGAGK